MRVQPAAAPVPTRPPAGPPPGHDPPPVSDRFQVTAHHLGRGLNWLSKVPPMLENHIPGLSPGFRTGLDGATLAMGSVSAVSFGVSGCLLMRRGNLTDVLSGAADLTRGGAIGLDAWGLGSSFPAGVGIASGALLAAAGLSRMGQHPSQPTTVNPRVVGALEVGIGVARMGSYAGIMTGPCLAVRIGLGTAKILYTRHQG